MIMGGPVGTPGRFWVLFLLPLAGYFLSFLFLFASGGLLLSVATKVTKSAIQGGRKFRSSFPLENPPSLSDQRGRAAALPLWKHPPGGVGDYQIAPLPRGGKGRWRPLAAVDMKGGRIPTGASRPRNDNTRTTRMLDRRCVGGDAHAVERSVTSTLGVHRPAHRPRMSFRI